MKFKPLSTSLFTLLMILTFTSCYTTSAPFNITSEGYPIESEMNPQILEKSIHLSLLNYGWEVTSKNEGKITAKYSKSEDLINANIEILFDTEGYSISYVDSKNLDFNDKRMTIHRNYNRWIANLNKSIAENYYILEII
ncbi:MULTISPECIES: hypothetical protein [unclassified Oceanispirochaeta]|uniref:hypothetical protein n=1 Tax=unclassified Oceanispirochaeta TaxID=2635722 RepID=UPI000E097083|nr:MULTISPECIES: hypothetical protein [unclassified Oceanispirochaeta]MBF9015470.1 hypothetical protein [Oceanispirochaeta sp. M2]NPD71929.1 hypothetical protein [Oceanispirochaeta sp. M1]RDG32737.1 hypothetical protein DV872_07445 [Oceanispirochaeta sp. M1]